MTHLKQLILCIIVLAPLSIFAQKSSDITTIILVRHAEKMIDGSKNPALSDQGKERAIRLKNLLITSETSVIYSTNFTRTQNTVQPLADALNLAVETYDPFSKQFTTAILSKHAGKTIVISGHSNTTPQLVNQFIGEEKYSSLHESEYSKIFIVSISKNDDYKVVILSY